jgi:tetratricopeptide (TPR) repeat protein
MDSELTLALQRAERWIDRDRPDRAIDLLEPLVASTPDNPDLHYTLGYARALSGDLWGGLSAFEVAAARSDDPTLLLPMVGLYMEAGLGIHALRVFRKVIDLSMSTPLMKEVRESAASIEQYLARTAQRLDAPVERVEQGLYDMERGQRAVNENDFHAAVPALQRAIKRLGDWPPPHNNLSQALFYDGQPGEAVKEVRRVLAVDPQNLQALANGIRFLTWSGREEEARELWERLKDITPPDANERAKKAEAAAVLDEHESVYETLKPLDEAGAAEEMPLSLMNRAQYFLAIAEANTGRRRQAEQRLRALQNRAPLAAETLTALKAGKSGRGWSEQFEYFSLPEMVPRQHIDALLDLVAQEDRMPPARFRRRMERMAKRFPQLVLAGEQMIWNEQQPQAGIAMLSTIGTPEAYAALRRFALSQVGDDEARMDALSALTQAGEIGEGETVRAWLDGEWREIELSLMEVPVDGWRESDYAPQVVDTLNWALTAYQRGDVERAEALFERVLELDAYVKEAYNNLGTIYARREEHERARDMFRKAIEIDPAYVFPLCNLAGYLIAEDQVEEVEALLAPLSGVEGLHPQERAFYDFTRARILIERQEYDSAGALLQAVLAVRPDYEPAQEILARLETAGMLRDVMSDWTEAAGAYWERQRERDWAWRERLQEKLSTLEPTLAEALPLYTKDSLTETARHVIPRGGWSTLRKAELIDALIEALTNLANLGRVVERLTGEEQEALRTVLNRGGAMPWEDFDARYGNDLEASRYWQWHTPETTMGRLRLHGFLVEATVDDALYVAVPLDLREHLGVLVGSV